MKTKPGLLVIGPVPPPVDGRAVATAGLIRILRDEGVEVSVLDTQLASGHLRILSKALRCAIAGLRILAWPPKAVLIVASAGPGLLVELIPIAAARVRRRRTYLAHHAASYVRSPWRPMNWAVRLGGSRLRHIFLSDQMEREFCATYRRVSGDNVVISNAAYVEAQVEGGSARPCIVHISNLSRAKGSLAAIEVAERLNVPLMLGGPADTEVTAAVDRAQFRGCDVRLLGPLSHRDKSAIFASARVFLFPSTYEHEAQPMVIFEAAAAGAVPITWGIGWVQEQMRSLELERFAAPLGDLDALRSLTASVIALTDAEFSRLSFSVRARCSGSRDSALKAASEFAHSLS